MMQTIRQDSLIRRMRGQTLSLKAKLKLVFVCLSLVICLSLKSRRQSIAFSLLQHRDNVRVTKLAYGDIYWCGYDLAETFVSVTFPEFKCRPHVEYKETNAKGLNDVLVLGAVRGQCQYIIDNFKGRIIHLNPEGHGVGKELQRKDVLHLGPRNLDKHSLQLYYVSLAAMELAHEQFLEGGSPTQDILLSNRFWSRYGANLTKRRFLLYVSRRCLPHREKAFNLFASVDRVTAASLCTGNLTEGSFDRIQKSGRWQTHVKQFGGLGFKFSLVMENILEPGYVTEKILGAFLSGTVPIYFGTEEVFDIFNRNAFVYYNTNDTQKTLEEVKNLNRDDRALSRMLAEDILTPGAREKYFNFKKIREKIEVFWCQNGYC